jgi:hypothetical protein
MTYRSKCRCSRFRCSDSRCHRSSVHHRYNKDPDPWDPDSRSRSSNNKRSCSKSHPATVIASNPSQWLLNVILRRMRLGMSSDQTSQHSTTCVSWLACYFECHVQQTSSYKYHHHHHHHHYHHHYHHTFTVAAIGSCSTAEIIAASLPPPPIVNPMCDKQTSAQCTIPRFPHSIDHGSRSNCYHSNHLSTNVEYQRERERESEYIDTTYHHSKYRKDHNTNGQYMTYSLCQIVEEDRPESPSKSVVSTSRVSIAMASMWEREIELSGCIRHSRIGSL